MKPEGERGHYLYPEIYNDPEAKNVEWLRDPKLMRQCRSGATKSDEERKSHPSETACQD